MPSWIIVEVWGDENEKPPRTEGAMKMPRPTPELLTDAARACYYAALESGRAPVDLTADEIVSEFGDVAAAAIRVYRDFYEAA